MAIPAQARLTAKHIPRGRVGLDVVFRRTKSLLLCYHLLNVINEMTDGLYEFLRTSFGFDLKLNFKVPVSAETVFIRAMAFAKTASISAACAPVFLRQSS